MQPKPVALMRTGIDQIKQDVQPVLGHAHLADGD